jgi:hypothetical protein
VAATTLDLTRAQILARRRAVGALEARLPAGPESLRIAAWAGLQDSMPRAALLSIHARVAGTGPATWEDPSLAQIWGPRYSAYVVAAVDVAVFTLGRLPSDGPGLDRATRVAARLDAYLAGRTLPFAETGHALGVHPNSLRYAAPTGRLRIRWDGARQPAIWMVPAPNVEPHDARLEMVRRYLRVFGPGTAAGFGEWAGIRPPGAKAAFEALTGSLTQVRTPAGEAWILAEDEQGFRTPAAATAPARLLPSGDAYYLLQGVERELLVPDPARRGELWTTRVWPGALLVHGEVSGTWRRSQGDVVIHPWRALTDAERDAVEIEAAALPLPGIRGPIRVGWER